MALNERSCGASSVRSSVRHLQPLLCAMVAGSTTSAIGRVTRVRGSVVDVEFDAEALFLHEALGVLIARSGGAPGLLTAFVGFLVARPPNFYGTRKGAAPYT